MGKRKGRTVIIVFLLLFLPLIFSPIPLSSVSAQANDAELLVKRIEARYGRMRGLAAEFEQVYTAQGGRVRRETGRLFLARPRKMRWEYPGKLFIVNGRDVWFYIPSDREATHAYTGAVSDERFPFLFLLGQANLRRAFSSISIVEDGNASQEARTLRLVPRNNRAGLREVFLTVSMDGRILKVKMLDDAGSLSEISLSNVREDYVAPSEAFQFTPPPGVIVRKQR
jgi:outer membrane lipoprotein carrier protein